MFLASFSKLGTVKLPAQHKVSDVALQITRNSIQKGGKKCTTSCNHTVPTLIKATPTFIFVPFVSEFLISETNAGQRKKKKGEERVDAAHFFNANVKE